MAVTRNDVAKLAGVSSATVSYVINNGPRPVSTETRERVLQAIDQLNYHPNSIARSLKTNRTNSAGIIISDIVNPTLALIEKSIEDQLIQQNYSLTICDSEESPERELMWLRTLRERRVDGLIILPTGDNQAFLASMIETGQPVVLMDREIEGVEADVVLFDNEKGAYEATRHLLSLNHRTIGFLNLSASMTPGRERLRGYERAMREAGCPIHPQLIVEGSYKACEGTGLAADLLNTEPHPTALLVSSNRLALGVLRHAKANGLHMPDDFAMCTFDDTFYHPIMTPSITTVAADTAEFGAKAVEFLIQRINGTYCGPPRTYRVPCHLIVRESTMGIGAV